MGHIKSSLNLLAGHNGGDWAGNTLNHSSVAILRKRATERSVVTSKAHGIALAKLRCLGIIREAEEQLRVVHDVPPDITVDYAELATGTIIYEESSPNISGFKKDLRSVILEEEDKVHNLARFIDRMIEDKACAVDRSENGFSWVGGIIGGHFRAPYQVRGLKSSADPILLLFASKINRGRIGPSRKKNSNVVSPITASNDKTETYAHSKKIIALDYSHIDSNKLMRGLIRVDIDKNFKSISELKSLILAAGCPLPNLVVGRTMKSGDLERPHLYYILRDSVCWTEKGRRAPKALFRAVQDAIHERLQKHGADFCALSNSLRGKNPLSEHWDTSITEYEPYTLGGDSNSKHNLSAVLKVKHARRVSRANYQGSNPTFGAIIHWASRMIHHYHPLSRINRWPGANDAMELFRNDLIAYMKCHQIGDGDKIIKSCKSVVEHFWKTYDPSRASASRRRGIMRTMDITPSPAVRMLLCARKKKDKMSAGAAFTAEVKRKQKIDTLMAAIRKCDINIDSPLAIGLLVEETGISRAQCYRYKAELQILVRSGLEPSPIISAQSIEQDANNGLGVKPARQRWNNPLRGITITIPAAQRSSKVEIIIDNNCLKRQNCGSAVDYVIRKLTVMNGWDSRRFGVGEAGYTILENRASIMPGL